MYKGGCLCGAVRFEVTGPINDIVFCHCTECRRVQGSAFATNGWVAANHFKITSGKELLATYAHIPSKTKHFCKLCASPIMSINEPNTDQIRVRLGTFDGEVEERPKCHIFTAFKANWYQINDDLPQYKAWPE